MSRRGCRPVWAAVWGEPPSDTVLDQLPIPAGTPSTTLGRAALRADATAVLDAVALARTPAADDSLAGLHTTTLDGWSLEIVSPEWPHPGYCHQQRPHTLDPSGSGSRPHERGQGMRREDLAAMPREQTTACGPARDVLLSGGVFVIWDGLAPANQVMHTYRTRLRITQKRGQQTQAVAVTVNILDKAGDVLLQIGRIAPPVRHGKGARGSGPRERMVPLINGADRTLRGSSRTSGAGSTATTPGPGSCSLAGQNPLPGGRRW
ncbi:hypothetical protein [Streptomyces sp. SCL15-6]|uniref:hypothetical protein n=1 Tax=Streptomyces sp. SCL15-6 TaxID=2967222 RepID=UPI002965EA44|nr:hypothetical protein [Streptomyces sp. SCL15-6]